MTEPGVRRHLRVAPDRDGPSDADLVNRFAADRDAAAFELLVWRHAAMVLGVCHGVLRDRHEAEDAAQAVFLALARQASQVGRTGTVAGWLFRVSRRIAARAAVRNRGRAESNIDLDTLPDREPVPAIDADFQIAIQNELTRLPDPYRSAVLLCFFEGLTHAQAAGRLGWPVGTVAGRLARAKDLLARRLSGRWTAAVVLPVVSGHFVASTASAAVSYAGRTECGVSTAALGLANTEVRTMAATRIVRLAAALAAATTLMVGLVWASDPPPKSVLPVAAKLAPVPVPAPAKPLEPVIADTFAIAPVTTALQRRLIFSSDETLVAAVFVDRNGVFRDPKVLDYEAVDMRGLKAALAPFRTGTGGSVYFRAIHRSGGDNPSSRGSEMLHFALEGLGYKLGFARAVAHDGNAFVDWKEYIAPLRTVDGDSKEDAGGDERAKFYPVRTALSRLLMPNADGVVDVRTALDPRNPNWLPADTDASVRAAVAGLKLPKGKAVTFCFNIPNERDDKTLPRLVEQTEKWAAAYDLKGGSVSY